MKLILTSFAFNQLFEPSDRPSAFFRLPPVNVLQLGTDIFPDYHSLLLCDKLLVDKASFEFLKAGIYPSPIYYKYAETLNILFSEGFVEIVDFKQILDTKRLLLNRMVENDLTRLHTWLPILVRSMKIWRRIAQRLRVYSDLTNGSLSPLTYLIHGAYSQSSHVSSIAKYVLEQLESGQFIESSEARQEKNAQNLLEDLVDEIFESLNDNDELWKKRILEDIRLILIDYLSYINANIIISSEIQAGFQDWVDFMPFYHKKFSQNQKIPKTQARVEAVQRLFHISFPEFAITNPKTLLRVLKDKRIHDLRQLVQEAVDGKVIFDEYYAHKVLKEVLNLERKSAKRQRIVSYLTLPLDLLPTIGTLAAKATEEVVGRTSDYNLKKPYRWFYMLNDVTEGN